MKERYDLPNNMPNLYVGLFMCTHIYNTKWMDHAPLPVTLGYQT
jgi:hypothetical protein